MDDATVIFSQEAERALIANVLSDPGLYGALDIKPDDFYVSKHKMIWQAFEDVFRSGASIDLVTMGEKLAANKTGDNWIMYLAACINETPTFSDAKSNAAIILDKASRRKMVQIASKIATTAHDKAADINQVLPTFIDQLADTAKIENAAQPFKTYLSRLYDDVSERHDNPTEIWGLRTGFSSFDRITGGLQQGETLILSGVPGVGKSILGMQLGINLGKNYPGVIYSMEMGAMQTTRRIVSGYAKMPTRQLKTGKLADFDTFTNCISELSLLPVWMSDSAGWTTTSLRADLSRLKAQHDIKWFVLDYLYLLNDGGGSDEIERTSLASKGLKRICKELNMAGVVIHSMNKAGMASEIPDQSMLRGSGQAVYDADLITFLTKFKPMTAAEKRIKDPEAENLRTLWFGKGRELEDPQRYIHFTKFTGYPAFAEASTENETELPYYQK